MSSGQKLWGGRFTDDPTPQMQALNDSIGFDQVLYAEDIAGSMAYAKALARANIISGAEFEELHTGLEAVLAEFEAGNFVIIATDEDIHTAVERRLTELIGAVAGKLHTGRSRNDQVATDLRLWLRKACAQVNELVKNLQMVLIKQAEGHLHTLMPGYTHFQPAQPISVAHWLMCAFWALQRDRERLAECAKRVNFSPLGSSALAGTPYPIDREQLAADLGFDGVTLNSLDGVSDRDGVAEFLFIASMIGIHLSRLGEEVVIFSNPAFGFIRLPDAYSTGSSLMPQKRNPDPMETARGKAGRLIGHLTGLLAVLKGLPTGYNKDFQEDKEPLFDALNILSKLLPVMAGMVRQLKFNPERMRAALDASTLSTELADWLVLEKDIPFREAHHLIGRVVRLAEDEGVSLAELPLSAYQSVSPVFEESLYQVLDFEAAVAKRKATGGTSPEAVQQQIQQAQRLMNASSQEG